MYTALGCRTDTKPCIVQFVGVRYPLIGLVATAINLYGCGSGCQPSNHSRQRGAFKGLPQQIYDSKRGQCHMSDGFMW